MAERLLPATIEEAEKWGEDILQVAHGKLTVDVGYYPSTDTYPDGAFVCVVIDHTVPMLFVGSWCDPYERFETQDPARVQRWLRGFDIESEIVKDE